MRVARHLPERNGCSQNERRATSCRPTFPGLWWRKGCSTNDWQAHSNQGDPNGINGTYPGKRPLSTVPANILARLPRLPDDVQYRFLGRHLILHDTRANLILDPYAIRCADCDTQPLEPGATLRHKKCHARQFH